MTRRWRSVAAWLTEREDAEAEELAARDRLDHLHPGCPECHFEAPLAPLTPTYTEETHGR